MSVKFGSDGTLYCNTVRYNRKQARNMIADGCYGNISGSQVWEMSNVSVATSPAGYKSYRSWQVNSSTSSSTKYIQQSVPTPVKNHEYYATVFLRTASNFTGRIVMQYYNNSASVGATRQDFLDVTNLRTADNWVKYSGIVTFSDVNTSSQWKLRVMTMNTTQVMYYSKVLMIDLTETFGAGNEPTKAWCDNNIREHEVYVNYGSVSSAITASNYNSYFIISNGNAWIDNANYLQVDGTDSVRDYQMYFRTANTVSQSSLTSNSSMTLDPSITYHFQFYERHGTLDGSSIDGTSSAFYFPSGNILGSQVPLVNNWEFNGGGGMRDWKRISVFGTRNGYTSGSYPMKVAFNNRNKSMHFWATGFVLLNAATNLTQYNAYNGTNVPLSDINKEWCDRWIDGRSSSIIHIKDPNNTAIKFNTSYDVICNDIEIRPELNKITMDSTGTIKCKKLVKTQNY